MTAQTEKEIHEIALLLFTYVPCNKLPKYVVDQIEKNDKQYGACGEVILESIHEAMCMRFVDGYEVTP